MAGSYETKANSAQFQVKLPTGAELGNTGGKLKGISKSKQAKLVKEALFEKHLKEKEC